MSKNKISKNKFQNYFLQAVINSQKTVFFDVFYKIEIMNYLLCIYKTRNVLPTYDRLLDRNGGFM